MKNKNSKFAPCANANDPYLRHYATEILNFSRALFRANIEITRRDSLLSQPKAKMVARNSQGPTTNHSSPKRIRRVRNANHFDLQCEYSLFSIKRQIKRDQAQEDHHKFEYSPELMHKNHEIKAENLRKILVQLISIFQLIFFNSNNRKLHYLGSQMSHLCLGIRYEN